MKKITLFIFAIFCVNFLSAQIVNIPDNVLKNKLLNYSPTIDANNDGEIQVSEAEAVTGELDLHFEWGEQTIVNPTGLESFINLTSLNLKSNDISAIDLSQNTMLLNLNIEQNNLSSINVSNLQNLEVLNLGNNNLSSIDVSNLQNLEVLNLSINNLSSIDVSPLSNLEGLFLSNNALTSIDIANLTQLENLEIHHNELTSIDLGDNINLVNLNTRYNSLTSLDISNNPNLETLVLMDMPNLQYLNLKNGNNENMSSIEPFYNMPEVEYVCVDNVEVFFENLYVEEWQGEPWFTISTNCNFGENQLNRVSGTVKYDVGAGCEDPTAILAPNVIITSQVGQNEYGTITGEDGTYILYTDEGENSVEASSPNVYFNFNPSSQELTFIGYDNEETVNFCGEATTQVNDLSIAFLPMENAMPGFKTHYKIVYTNEGTTTLDGEISLSYDESLQSFVEASPTETSTDNNSITFEFSDLHPFESDFIEVELLNEEPPVLNGGDILSFEVEIVTSETDNTPENNTVTFDQEAVNSFDPNDKQVLEGEEIKIEDTNKYLHYIIRFQNTGTANAQKVVVRDTLSYELDWSSLQMLSASNSYHINIVNGNALEFTFSDIDLPFEDADEEGSHGYIAYKIKPKAGIAVGDIIEGDAAIYFDYNEPIITNTVSTEVTENFSVTHTFLEKIQVYPNPTTGIINFKIPANVEVSKVEVFSITGKQLWVQKTRETIDISKFSNGIYFLNITSSNGNQITKKIIKK